MKLTSNLDLILVIGTIMVLLLVLFIMFIIFLYQRRTVQHRVAMQQLELEKQHSVLQALLEGEEIERKRLAEELHDGTGQVLMAIKMNLAHLNNAHQNNTGFDETFALTRQLAEESIAEIRLVINNIMPPMLNETGLTDTLQHLCNKINNVSEINIAFTCDGTGIKCKPEKALSLYRITQELFNNSIKYSQASEIKVQLQKEENEIHLSFTDNGIGFEKDNIVYKPLSGYGLRNIENRVYLMHGKYEILSSPNSGTSVKIIVPVLI